MGTFISDIVLVLLSHVAENERIHRQWKDKKLILKQAAKACILAESTFLRKAKTFGKI